MYGWQWCLYHDNANGTNWLAAMNNCCWCARCCKNKLHADCDDNCLIGGLNVWCGWVVNLECNCKYVNVIAMVLQAVRSCAAVIVVCFGRFRYAMSAVWSLVLTLCVSFDCVLGLL